MTTNQEALTELLRDAAGRLQSLAENPWIGDGFAHQVEVLAMELETIGQDIALKSARAELEDREAVTAKQAAAINLKGLRDFSGWTQTEIAEAMNRLGFVGWKRITVAECESGKRALSIEEAIGYGILFSTPAALLYVAGDGHVPLQLNERLRITAREAAHILTGQDVDPDGGIYEDDPVPAMIIGVYDQDESNFRDWRPAVDLRRNR